MAPPLVDLVVATSSVVVAVATVGIYRRVDQLVSMVEKHERTLYGEEGVEAWQGLVERVAQHETELDNKRAEGTDQPDAEQSDVR